MSDAQVFARYLLLERVATGSMAEVFRARALGAGPEVPDVAVKRLLPGLASDGWAARQYLAEIEALRRIDHPAVVRLLAEGRGHGLPYIAMPWLGGVNLRQLYNGLAGLAGPAGSGAMAPPLQLAVALAIAAQVADGLASAHQQGVIHRDLSPTNVQISNTGQVVIIDFGIAQVHGLPPHDGEERMPGKWAYASPEQRLGQPLDHRTDLFALGLLLRELVSGQGPDGQSDDHRQRLMVDNPTLQHLLDSLLAAEPNQRPDEAREAGVTLAKLSKTYGDIDVPMNLKNLLSLLPERPPAPPWTAAELRGEAVTQPHLDPDATLIRM